MRMKSFNGFTISLLVILATGCIANCFASSLTGRKLKQESGGGGGDYSGGGGSGGTGSDYPGGGGSGGTGTGGGPGMGGGTGMGGGPGMGMGGTPGTAGIPGMEGKPGGVAGFRTCSTPSLKYRGFCFTGSERSNCQEICAEEGFINGHCTIHGCHCTKPC